MDKERLKKELERKEGYYKVNTEQYLEALEQFQHLSNELSDKNVWPFEVNKEYVGLDELLGGLEKINERLIERIKRIKILLNH